ncbi:MAG: efflux RND transporter permease subunit, partial [Planctomycetota bacterium]
NAASGSIEEGRTEYLVRTLNEYRTPREIEETILVTRDGQQIRLSEVAKVERRPADPQVICRVGDRPCVLVDIYKEASANVVEVCTNAQRRVFGESWQQDAVKEGLHERAFDEDVDAKDLDPQAKKLARAAFANKRTAMTDFLAFEMGKLGITPVQLQDQSRFIADAISEVQSNALQGGVLAVLVILLFLRSLVATAILAVSIPLSLLATFAPMFLVGIDLNVMSLGGLALGVGMLVDNSIVVLESIEKRREAGESAAVAAVLGTARVAGAVVASTLTTVAVFFPIVFVEGLGGQLFRDQSLTVVFALMMSLLVALFVVPMLASRGGGGLGAFLAGLVTLAPLELLHPEEPAVGTTDADTAKTPPVEREVPPAPKAAWLAALDRSYRSVLRGSLQRPWLVVGIALVLVVAAVLRAGSLGQQVLPEVHQGEFWLQAFLPRSVTVETTDSVMRGIETKVQQVPEVARTFLASGVDPEELNDSEEGKHSSRILVTLQPTKDRQRQELEVRARIEAILREVPAVQTHRFATSSVLQFNAGVVVEVIGHDLDLLRQACDKVAAAISKLPQLRDVRTTLQRGNPELTVRFDRDQLSALSLDPGAITALLRAKVQGDVPTQFAERERKLDIRVRMDRDELASEAALGEINVNPKGVPEIPLRSVAEVLRREGPSEIRRFGNVRGAEVSGTLDGFDLARAQLEVEAAIADLDLPRGTEARIGGQKEELERSRSSLTMALLLAIFLVYVVMASQFESIVQPLVILVSVPLATIGVVFALDLTDTDLSVIVFLGAIVLAGIVVNNAIILIDQINYLRTTGMPLREAIVEGSASRLRPVLMTTLTTLIGLLPQTGWTTFIPYIGGSTDGLELRAPMAITVIAGLSSSTLLTLLLVPVVYGLVARKRA